METLMRNFTHAAVLIAECLAAYYRTGELVVFDYGGENYNPVEHHIKDFTVTEVGIQPLLEELKKVQKLKHYFSKVVRGRKPAQNG